MDYYNFMKHLTQLGLNLLQKAKLDYLAVKALNNRICNPLILKYGWQKRDYLSYYEQYQVWREKLKSHGVAFKDKKILDAGSGGSIGLGYFFLKDDFKFWLSADWHHDLKTDKNLIKREASLIREVFKNYDKNIFKEVQAEENGIIFGRKFDFRRLEITERAEDLTGNFDIIITSAVLEHITESSTETSLINLKSYLKIGGVMIHEIDLRDHINPASPFAFYKYGLKSWENLTGGTIFYTNRLRAVDYLKMFARLNFKIRFLEADSQPLPERLKIDDFFRKYKKEELASVRLFIIIEKL